jgi:GntR family transcriptional regulator
VSAPSQLHGDLRDRITSGRLSPGSLLPSQRDLAARCGVSIMTVRQALQLLADDGLIETRHGSGTITANRSPGRLDMQYTLAG